MRRAAAGQKEIVIVDNAGQTYRGAARSFEDWYRSENCYAALYFDAEDDEVRRLESRDILYIEVCR